MTHLDTIDTASSTLVRPDFFTWHNGERATLPFSRAEYDRRLAGLRAIMAERDIEAALITSMHGVAYYSGFLYCAFGRPYACVVTQDRSVTVSANIDAGQPWRRSADENVVYTDWQRDNYFRAVQKLIKDGQTVGIEFDHVSLQIMEKLKIALPEARFVDIAETTRRLRMLKYDEEIANITKMTAIADLGGAACVEAIGVGVGEHEVALHTTQAMVREIGRVWPDGELLDTWTWFQSGLNTDGAHNPVTARKIESGDILSMNCFPVVAG